MFDVLQFLPAVYIHNEIIAICNFGQVKEGGHF